MVLVGIDSPALTYLVEAIKPGYDPSADDPVLAAERVAMVRNYVYGGVQFWVLPTVECEYNRIRDPDRHLRHERAAWILLHNAPIRVSAAAIDTRAAELLPFHAGISDCLIVAEAELADSANPLSVLVTFDDDLIDHLTGRTRLTLQYPSAFWQSLGIGPGATPVTAPHPSNPLAHVDWWRV
jgi:hypothetical protein